MATLSRLTEVDVAEVKTLGGTRTPMLAKAGILTVADLLHHVPRRYIDRSLNESIAEASRGTEVTVVGEVRSVTSRRIPKRKLMIVEATIFDDSASLKAIWFNQPFRAKQLVEGARLPCPGWWSHSTAVFR